MRMIFSSKESSEFWSSLHTALEEHARQWEPGFQHIQVGEVSTC